MIVNFFYLKNFKYSKGLLKRQLHYSYSCTIVTHCSRLLDPLAQLLSGAHQGVEFLFQALLLHENTFQYVLQEEEVEDDEEEEEEEEEEEGEGEKER